MSHIPVLLHEVIEALDPRPGETFIDGTVNGAGHARELARRIAPSGTYIAVDLDARAVEAAEHALRGLTRHVIVQRENFRNLKSVLASLGCGADGLLLDLGFSSNQMEGGYGLSFAADEPLDMRYDSTAPVSARDIVSREAPQALAELFRTLGEEPFAAKIASAIGTARLKEPIETTKALERIVIGALPKGYVARSRRNPATRVFMALRMAVNRELENLEAVLCDLPDLMNPGGRIAIISFHSLEDRMVKQAFRRLVQTHKVALHVKKPITPGEAERTANPRSRSAKLRAIRLPL